MPHGEASGDRASTLKLDLSLPGLLVRRAKRGWERSSSVPDAGHRARRAILEISMSPANPCPPARVAIVTGSATGVARRRRDHARRARLQMSINYTRSKAEAGEDRARPASSMAPRPSCSGRRRRGRACGYSQGRGRQNGPHRLPDPTTLPDQVQPAREPRRPDQRGLPRDHKVNVAAPYPDGARGGAAHAQSAGKPIVNNSSIGGVTGIASSMAYVPTGLRST